MTSRKLPSCWWGGQPLRLVPGGSLKGGEEAGTSSMETSSNSRSELPGGQDREGDGRLGFLSTGGGKGWRFRFLGGGEEGSRPRLFGVRDFRTCEGLDSWVLWRPRIEVPDSRVLGDVEF